MKKEEDSINDKCKSFEDGDINADLFYKIIKRHNMEEDIEKYPDIDLTETDGGEPNINSRNEIDSLLNNNYL